MLFSLLLLVFAGLQLADGKLYVCGKHICYNNQRVFLNGVNQAWVAYGYDFGNHQYQYRKSKFIQILNGVHANGGNSIRIWLHVEGQTSPKFDHNGYVTGLDNDGTLITELKEYLHEAHSRNIFVFITLWNGADKGQYNYRLYGLIKDTRKLQSYLNHALKPIVQALKYEPALGGYDIMNEPEGVITPDESGSSCTDTHFLHNSGAGWKGHLYHASELQRFINLQADIIRQNDANTLVTVGSWNPKSNTNQHGMRNLYSDACLRAAGGKQNILNGVHANGGNSIRIWLHVEGQTSPKFDHNGYVTGLDNDGTLITELKEYLHEAHSRNIFVFITLWNGADKGQYNYRLYGLIKDTRKLQSYLNHALKPIVQALKYEPALGGYDIMNEPEGVITPDESGSSCTDTHFLHNSGAGWKGHLYHASELQRFINLQADIIRQNDANTLVTVGSWNPKSNTNQHGMRNLYSDACLRAAGGKQNGVLNFYSTHTYDNNHHFDSLSPFGGGGHPASYYDLNKPLVIAEFNQVRGGGWTIDGMFLHAYNHGYAGAWSWHANADGSNTDSFATQEKGMRALKGKHDTQHGGYVNVRI